jgi:hypothetical protein
VDYGATSLNSLQSLLRTPHSASRNSSISHGKATTESVLENFHVAQHIQKDINAAVHAGDMKMSSVV